MPPRKKGTKATKAKAAAKATASNRTTVTVNVGASRSRRTKSKGPVPEGSASRVARPAAMYHPPVVIHNASNQAENVAHTVRQVLGEAYGHIKSGAVQHHAVPAPVVASIPAAVQSPTLTPASSFNKYDNRGFEPYDMPTPVKSSRGTSTAEDSMDKLPAVLSPTVEKGVLKIRNPSTNKMVGAHTATGKSILSMFQKRTSAS